MEDDEKLSGVLPSEHDSLQITFKACWGAACSNNA